MVLNPAMFEDWPELSSLLARALPTANVNFLYPEDSGEYRKWGELQVIHMYRVGH